MLKTVIQKIKSLNRKIGSDAMPGHGIIREPITICTSAIQPSVPELAEKALEKFLGLLQRIIRSGGH